jgi:hypothetical protein
MTTQDSIVVVRDHPAPRPQQKKRKEHKQTNKKFIIAKDFDSENNK